MGGSTLLLVKSQKPNEKQDPGGLKTRPLQASVKKLPPNIHRACGRTKNHYLASLSCRATVRISLAPLVSRRSARSTPRRSAPSWRSAGIFVAVTPTLWRRSSTPSELCRHTNSWRPVLCRCQVSGLLSLTDPPEQMLVCMVSLRLSDPSRL